MNWRRWAGVVGVAVVIAWVLIVGALYLGQRSLMFLPPDGPGTSSRPPIEEVFEGTPVVIALYPAPPGARTVVMFHGNADRVSDLDVVLFELSSRGLGAAAIEYPGYGRCPGSPSEESLFATADAGLRDLQARGVTDIVLLGQSLGTGVATEMAVRGYGSRLVLVSPFTSMTAMAREQYPFAPSFLLRDRFDTDARAPNVRIPVLIAHGDRDQLVPYRMGVALSRRFPDVTLHTLTGVGHNDVWRGDLVERVVAFAR